MRGGCAPMLAAAVLATTGGCRGPTDEAKIHRLLADAVTAVEAGRTGEVMDAVAEDYRDDAGNDKAALRGLLAAQMLRGTRITVVRRDEEITVDGAVATASFDAALFRGDRSRLKGLLPERSGTYRFTFTLRKDGGDWRVTSASYRSIDAASFVVNSIK